MRSPQIWVVLFLLVTTVGLIHLRGDTDRVPPTRPLAELPATIGSWGSTDIPISSAVLEVLGKGVFLNRIYRSAATLSSGERTAPIGLFIGYFPTQRSGQSIHSPQNCLPGAGWNFESSGVTELADKGEKRLRVGEYVISNGTERQEVFYWYRTHGHDIANDYVAKIRMLTDSILYNRTDAALIRVTTPFLNGESQRDAHLRALRFTEHVIPMLPAYIPN